jgi:hypothetical protein
MRRFIIASVWLHISVVVPDRVAHSTTAKGPVMSDLNMMVMSGGRERTATEQRALLEAAGFTLTKIIPTQCKGERD